MDTTLVVIVGEHTLDQYLDLAAGFLDAEKACFKYACVVKYQQVARRQQIDDIGKMPVSQLCAVHLQQTRSAALWQWHLRNQLGWQVEIEIGKRVHANK